MQNLLHDQRKNVPAPQLAGGDLIFVASKIDRPLDKRKYMRSGTNLERFRAKVEQSGILDSEPAWGDLAFLPEWAVKMAVFPGKRLAPVEPGEPLNLDPLGERIQDGKRPAKNLFWERSAGQPGQDRVVIMTDELQYGIPFGMGARWTLVLLCRALMDGQQALVKNTIGEVLELCGRGTGGGPQGFTVSLRRAFLALIHCEIIYKRDETLIEERVSPFQAPQRPSCWATDPLRFKITGFNPSFVEYVSEDRGVPVDVRRLAVLLRDVLAFDLLVFLGWRACSIQETRVLIGWPCLMGRLGSQIGRTRDFRRNVKMALEKIEILWPGFDYEVKKDGLILYESPALFNVPSSPASL